MVDRLPGDHGRRRFPGLARLRHHRHLLQAEVLFLELQVQLQIRAGTDDDRRVKRDETEHLHGDDGTARIDIRERIASLRVRHGVNT